MAIKLVFDDGGRTYTFEFDAVSACVQFFNGCRGVPASSFGDTDYAASSLDAGLRGVCGDGGFGEPVTGCACGDDSGLHVGDFCTRCVRSDGTQRGRGVGSFDDSLQPVDCASQGAPGARGVAGVVDGSPVGRRGPNWERNNAARIRRKTQRQVKREMMNCDWRTGFSSESVEQGGKKGFFSGCDESVQKDLRDSRAKMLIAKNKRLEAEESGKLERMQSVEGVVAELVRVTKMASQLKRQTSDSKIGGWAETVADTLARSVAESAPSSVPSLESVGYGKSALMSSDGTFSDSERLADYNRRVAILDDTFSGIGGYSEDDYEFALAKLKKEFSDVAFTPVQHAEAQVCSKLMSVMFSCGIEAKKMVEVMEEMGHPVC